MGPVGLEPTARTFVSAVSAQGVPLESIADVLGHQGTAVTERVYRHQLKPVLIGHTAEMNATFSFKGQGT